MKILYRKEIDVPSGFYCTNCQCLMSERNMQISLFFIVGYQDSTKDRIVRDSL